MASMRMLRLLLLSLSVGRQSVSVSATVTAVSEPLVSAVVSVTAITELQVRRHFRLRPKPEKVISVGLYIGRHLEYCNPGSNILFVAFQLFSRRLFGVPLAPNHGDCYCICRRTHFDPLRPAISRNLLHIHDPQLSGDPKCTQFRSASPPNPGCTGARMMV